MNGISRDTISPRGFRFFDTIHFFDMEQKCQLENVAVDIVDEDNKRYLAIRCNETGQSRLISEEELNIVIQRENVIVLRSDKCFIVSMAFVGDYVSEKLGFEYMEKCGKGCV